MIIFSAIFRAEVVWRTKDSLVSITKFCSELLLKATMVTYVTKAVTNIDRLSCKTCTLFVLF